MRVVLDTNVFVSPFFSTTSSPAQVVDAWRERRYKLLVSSGSLAELDEVLDREELAQYIRGTIAWIDAFRKELTDLATIVEPQVESVVLHDPDDDLIVGTALAGEADYIVSGDKHLLALGMVQAIRVVAPTDFLRLLDKTEPSP